MEPKLESHMLAGRLTAKESKIVGDMTKYLIKLKNILLDLKGRREDNMTIAKQIDNASHRYKLSIRGSRIEMQIFFAHLESVKMFNTFSIVLVMDSTYKTNQYKMSLVEIVGLT